MADLAQAVRYRAEATILELGEKIGDVVEPADFPQMVLRWRNDQAAQEVGLDTLSDTDWIKHFGRFQPLSGSLDRPLALRYHGHQFRVYNPEIGDGRGFLFAQLRDNQGRLLDLGTKGSGQTPYSRFGDGRLTLKGAVRELLATEMLAALGVPTSRTFSIIETGEELVRGDEPSPTRSAVLVRLNHSHIRIGSFQRLAFEGDIDGLEALARYALVHLLGHRVDAVAAMSKSQAALALLEQVVAATADLAAHYMVAGFVHGVLNTDNINVTGESFDYGPWRFAPHWDPGFTAAYFDHAGLYAFGRQGEAIHWNCAQLAISLRSLAEAEPMIALLDGFADRFHDALAQRFLWRLGVASAGPEADRALVAAGVAAMAPGGVGIDRLFFDRATGRRVEPRNQAEREFAKLIEGHAPARALDNPYWEGEAPCAMLIDEVEAIWAAIAERDDWQRLATKVAAVRKMGAAMEDGA